MSLNHLAAVACVLGTLGLALGAAEAADKAPPSCAAIAFRPVPVGLNDGEQDAGLYKSRFGRIEVKAIVKSGTVQSYYVEINGKRPTSVAAKDLPKTIVACAKTKRLTAPGTPAEPCMGDRLTVLIAHNADRRYLLFYGHAAGKWQYCSAGTA